MKKRKKEKSIPWPRVRNLPDYSPKRTINHILGLRVVLYGENTKQGKTLSVRLHIPFRSNDVEGNAVEIEEGRRWVDSRRGSGEIARR